MVDSPSTGEESSLCAWGLWRRIEQGSPREGIALLRVLLQAGKDLFATDERGRTCAHLAADLARGWELHFLLSIERASRERTPDRLRAQESLLRARTHDGDALLHIAAARGHVPVVRYLVTAWAGQDINGSNSSGRTALHEAAANDHYQVVKVLLKAGVAIDLVDLGGSRPEDLAPAGETKRLLREAKDKITQMREPRYGVVAYLRCQASYALDRVLTPVAYSLADTYTPPPLRRAPTLAAAAFPIVLALASFILPLPLSVAAILASCLSVRALPAHVLSCSHADTSADSAAAAAAASRYRAGDGGGGTWQRRCCCCSSPRAGRGALLCWEENEEPDHPEHGDGEGGQAAPSRAGDRGRSCAHDEMEPVVMQPAVAYQQMSDQRHSPHAAAYPPRRGSVANRREVAVS